MPITGLPTFEDNETPSAGKFNSIVQVVESKFSAITADDFTWPLVTQGLIDFDRQHSIVGLRTFWNYINAAEYDTLQLAIDAAEAAGGGCVIIPPDTTITTDTVTIEQSSIWIQGCGPSSIIKMTGGASGGYLIQTGAGTLTDIGLAHLTLDGSSVAGQNGFEFRFVDGCTVIGCTFKNFGSSALKLTHAGTPGTQKCQNAVVSDCKFEGGAGAHIDIEDLDVGVFSNITSTGGTATALIDGEPTSSAGFIKSLSFSNVSVVTPTGIGFRLLGASATANDNWSLNSLSNVSVTNSTGDSIILGATSKLLKHTTISGCSAINSGADGINVASAGGVVVACYAPNATVNGIDTTDSTNLTTDANYADGGTAAVVVAARQGNVLSGVDSASHAAGAGGTGDLGYLLTIPANTVQVGDIIKITAYLTFSYDAPNPGTLQCQVGGVSIGGYAAANASHEQKTEYTLFVEGLTGANTHVNFSAVSDVTAFTLAANSQVSVDWTTDTDITFNMTVSGGLSDGAVQGVDVRILGSNI